MSLTAAVITATTNPERARSCLLSWALPPDVPFIIVLNGPRVEKELPLPEFDATYLTSPSYLATVPAFRRGVDYALDHTQADVLVCLHDDLELRDSDWLGKTLRHFERTPQCGLAGFGGAIGLGADDIYQIPYNPMQLARKGFRSNMTDAEVHGVRSILAERVACLDGFSQIGRRDFFAGYSVHSVPSERPWTYFEDQGFYHHAYDSLLGAYARRLGWDAWYLPIKCKHFGGQTAVGDQGYQAWAKTQIPGGDQGFWEQSHRRGYELFKDVLPLRADQ